MASSASAGRLSFIDYLRGIAVLWMIEVHIIDICLDQRLKVGSFFEILDISNGFVAVAFIFCAGIGFQLAFEKKEHEYRQFGSALWGYVRRLSHILLLAYWLHLPAFSLQRLLGSSAIEWQRFVDCDVLQAIVFSSLIALGMSLSLRSAQARTVATAVLVLVSFGFAAVVLPWHLYSASANPFSALLTGVPVSKFPLIPYAGYFFSGMLVIRVFMQAENKQRMAWSLLAGFLVLCLTAVAIRGTHFDFFPGGDDWWHLSAGHAAFRLGVVAVCLMLLYLSRSILENTKLGDMLVLCGQESLFMYIFHLFVVYGYIGNYSLVGWAQHSWGWSANIACYAIITSITYFLCYRYHGFKKNQPQRSTKVVRYVVIAGLIIFCCIPAYLTLPR